jgi:uncharacterized protein (DUF1697 family)
MTSYIALLKGINVGGKNKIKMADLKRLFEKIGCHSVQTYINSGNVLFKSEEEEKALVKRVEDEIKRELGLAIKVVLRTVQELEQIIAASPYREAVDPKGKNVNVGFMDKLALPENIDRVKPYKEQDDFEIIGREVHLLFRQSVADSKLAKNLQKLNETVTIRNWNTVTKLAALAKEMVN